MRDGDLNAAIWRQASAALSETGVPIRLEGVGAEDVIRRAGAVVNAFDGWTSLAAAPFEIQIEVARTPQPAPEG